ncbi:MAG: hypothetical protein ACLRH0_06890 [Blautia wexlerae]
MKPAVFSRELQTENVDMSSQVLVHNEEKTREGFGHYKGTYHQTVLLTLAEALERMTVPSEICVHTRDVYVSSRIPKLEELAGSDGKTPKENRSGMQKNGSGYMRPSMPFLMHTNCQKRLRNTVTPGGCRRRWKRKDECRRTMGQRLEPKTGTGSKNNGMPGYHY